jgi:hypothetical protein
MFFSVFAVPTRVDRIELQVLGDIELGMMAVSESLGVDLTEETWKIRVQRDLV